MIVRSRDQKSAHRGFGRGALYLGGGACLLLVRSFFKLHGLCPFLPPGFACPPVPGGAASRSPGPIRRWQSDPAAGAVGAGPYTPPPPPKTRPPPHADGRVWISVPLEILIVAVCRAHAASRSPPRSAPGRLRRTTSVDGPMERNQERNPNVNTRCFNETRKRRNETQM